ncbi:TetR/AcrR family transcriptional regulator [Mycolicibacterium cosmeticum]|uniref:TetR/AcrR family transcriptional regulator n=1 Tax=Mycolicibacterium cosmeticum TaxID=258533 RepID=UPI00068519DF|nr:TetR/AcrR family transcriptional regulator [Mycolicibacterium cosmeticum]
MDDLLDEEPIADISVRAVSQRAGITRSAFYFYFETKYAALASLLSLHSGVDLNSAFGPRRADESQAAFIDRIVIGIRATLANEHPVWASSRSAAAADKQLAAMLQQIETTVVRLIVRAVTHEARRGAQPISDDLPRLVHTLLRASLVGCNGWRFDDEPVMRERSTLIAKALWQRALWPPRATVGTSTSVTDDARLP